MPETLLDLHDVLGSVRQLSDASGNIVQSYTYAPFGELLAAQGTRSSALQYSGEQKDVDTGLVYLRARWYDSATGRFTTRDPFPGFVALPQTLHPYVYVNNNPVNLTDPSGKIAFLPLLVVAVLGGIIGGVSYYTLQAILNADPCLGLQWHWQEALFWTGVGGGLGGLIGTGIYGGWWIGAHLGWWGIGAGTGIGAGIWNLPWWERGQIIEDLLGRNLARSFPVIDRFLNGLATSIKSLDLRASSYQNIGVLTSKIQQYLNSLANFQGARNIAPHMITGRELLLAVPANSGTPAQWAALQSLQQTAANLGITLTIVQIP
jgi:RHS repeat-associated protein